MFARCGVEIKRQWMIDIIARKLQNSTGEREKKWGKMTDSKLTGFDIWLDPEKGKQAYAIKDLRTSAALGTFLTLG